MPEETTTSTLHAGKTKRSVTWVLMARWKEPGECPEGKKGIIEKRKRSMKKKGGNGAEKIQKQKMEGGLWLLR